MKARPRLPRLARIRAGSVAWHNVYAVLDTDIGDYDPAVDDGDGSPWTLASWPPRRWTRPTAGLVLESVGRDCSTRAAVRSGPCCSYPALR
jgi:hypothetical protein